MKQKNNIEKDSLEAVEQAKEFELSILLLLTYHISKTLSEDETKALALSEIRKSISKETKNALKSLEEASNTAITIANDREYDSLKEKAPKLIEYKGNSRYVADCDEYFRKYMRSGGTNYVVGKNQRVLQYFNTFIEQNVKSVVDGTTSVNDAVKKAINELSSTGLKIINYENGTTRNIDVFVRQQIQYASKESTHELREEFAKKNGITIWEFDAHANARPSHQQWQGKRYDTTGRHYPTLNELTHGEHEEFGCKHIRFPVFSKDDPYMFSKKDLESINAKPFVWNGKEYDGYSAAQQQRKIEREIRALKREKTLLNENGFDDKEASYKLKIKNAQYSSFCKAFGTYKRNDRL
ncbi:phage minor capsid protein [Amedibacillus sp. YH-ame6]